MELFIVPSCPCDKIICRCMYAQYLHLQMLHLYVLFKMLIEFYLFMLQVIDHLKRTLCNRGKIKDIVRLFSKRLEVLPRDTVAI